MEHFILEIYRKKVAPKEKQILTPQKEWVKDFFETNIWGMVYDNDSIDSLFILIRELSSMGIPEISDYVCHDLIDWIVMNLMGKRKTAIDWNGLTLEKRKVYNVGMLDKGKFTEYFID